MENGEPFNSYALTRLASFLNGKGIVVEDNNTSYISSSIAIDEQIYITILSSLTVKAGPHWFEVQS